MCSPFVDCCFKVKYAVEETKMFLSICKDKENFRGTTKENSEKTVSENKRSELVNALAAIATNVPASSVLAQDDEVLSITSLALSLFEVV